MVTRSRGIGRSGSSCRNCTSCSTVTKPQRTQVLMPGIGELAGVCSLPHAPQARNDNWPAAAPPAACWVFEASRNRSRSCMCSSQSAGVGCSSISSSRDTILRATTVRGWPTAPPDFTGPFFTSFKCFIFSYETCFASPDIRTVRTKSHAASSLFIALCSRHSPSPSLPPLYTVL